MTATPSFPRRRESSDFVRLGDCCKFHSGGTPEKGKAEYWTGEIPWFSPKDVKAFDLTVAQDKISERAVVESATQLVMPGTILVVGRSGVLAHTLPVGIVRQASAFNQDIKAIVPCDSFDPEFIALYLRAMQTQVLTNGVKRGPTVHSLVANYLEDLEIPAPSLPEQRQIAARLKAQLADVDTAREAARAQVREAGLLRQRLLRQAFDSLHDAPRKVLGEWALSYRNGFGKRPSAGETGPIVLRIADVSSGSIDLSATRRGAVTSKEAVTYQLQTNNLLFIRVNGAREIVGRCCVVGSEVPDDTIFNDHLIRVCLKPGIDSEYAKFCAGAPSARARIEEAASTSAGQLTINQEVIASIDVPDLSFNEQRHFVNRLKAQLTEADAIAHAAAAQLAEIERLPQRLLAQAFSPVRPEPVEG